MTRGFSLVELSIVLVILGLLTGGILAGQSLIKAAELRAVTTEHQKYKTAIYSFRDKYMALPGDMPNATRFWGIADGADGVGSDCRDADTGDARTCNGNGNGIINDHPELESSRGWQQLANAGLIEGSYKGSTFATVTSCNGLGPNCVFPGSRYSSRAIWQYMRSDGAATQFYPVSHGVNLLQISGAGTTTTNFHVQYLFTPEQLWNIDTKLDDGRPGIGKVIAYRPGVCDTAALNDNSATAAASAQYRLTATDNSCIGLFLDVP
ncbi:MAG: hypothetical protein C0436_01625 [Alphaproteobacteria bacterium]|nr:hypothetical protein [Alphaproteobacteria bacterium]